MQVLNTTMLLPFILDPKQSRQDYILILTSFSFVYIVAFYQNIQVLLDSTATIKSKYVDQKYLKRVILFFCLVFYKVKMVQVKTKNGRLNSLLLLDNQIIKV